MDTSYRGDYQFYLVRAFDGLKVSLAGVALAAAMLASTGPLSAGDRRNDGSGGTPSAGLGAAGLGAAGAAQTAAADAAKTADTTRVWTNADIAKLPDPGISLIGPEPVTGVEAAPNQEPYDRTKDPYWYADEAARLQAELAQREAALQQYVEAIEDARNRRNTESGIALNQGDAGITLQSGIENLQSQVREVQEQLEELADLARRNGIVPGVVWG
jgi:hypothetical protein